MKVGNNETFNDSSSLLGVLFEIGSRECGRLSRSLQRTCWTNRLMFETLFEVWHWGGRRGRMKVEITGMSQRVVVSESNLLHRELPTRVSHCWIRCWSLPWANIAEFRLCNVNALKCNLVQTRCAPAECEYPLWVDALIEWEKQRDCPSNENSLSYLQMDTFSYLGVWGGKSLTICTNEDARMIGRSGTYSHNCNNYTHIKVQSCIWSTVKAVHTFRCPCLISNEKRNCVLDLSIKISFGFMATLNE